MSVNVGDGNAGNYYQIHVSSPTSIKRIGDGKGCFLIQQWHNVDSLVSEMNDFIDETLAKNKMQDQIGCHLT